MEAKKARTDNASVVKSSAEHEDQVAEIVPGHDRTNGLYARGMKRLLDLFFSILFLPFLFLATLLIAPLIWCADHGPVFYNAARLGYKGKIFLMYKFRSMKVDAPDVRLPDGSTYNSEDDPRQTKIGRFLRKTSLDELPQVLNVLKGDMSFVGPRPDLPDAMSLYQGNEKRKLLVRPGITGYCQAYYRNTIDIHKRFQYDVEYADNPSFLTDLRIIVKTITAVVRREGIYRNMSIDTSNNEGDGK